MSVAEQLWNEYYDYRSNRYPAGAYSLDRFDRQLNEYEAKKFLVHYSGSISHPEKLDKYLFFESKFLNCLLEIYDCASVYYLTEDEKIKKVDSRRRMKLMVKLNLREKHFNWFVVPTFELLMLGNFDLSFAIYAVTGNTKGIDRLRSFAEKRYLFLR